VGRSGLAAGDHKASFYNPCVRTAVSQTHGGEVWPNLLEAVLRNGWEQPTGPQSPKLRSWGLLTVRDPLRLGSSHQHQQPSLLIVPLSQLIFANSSHDRPTGSSASRSNFPRTPQFWQAAILSERPRCRFYAKMDDAKVRRGSIATVSRCPRYDRFSP